MVHEVRLLLLKISGEALGLDALHGGLDGLTLRSALSLFLLLDNLCETTVVALQRFAELGIGLTLVIEVGSVSYIKIKIGLLVFVDEKELAKVR